MSTIQVCKNCNAEVSTDATYCHECDGEDLFKITLSEQDLIRRACKAFLSSWDRQEWMQFNGTWESEKWVEAREAYDAAVEGLALAFGGIPSATHADADLSSIEEALTEVREAARALDGQVRPDESDYIAEGLIDPDNVLEMAEPLDVRDNWRGWDCEEGWEACRVRDALYLHWYRQAWGQRHDRSLWVLVDSGYFKDEENR